jgi:hypothetical protein
VYWLTVLFESKSDPDLTLQCVLVTMNRASMKIKIAVQNARVNATLEKGLFVEEKGYI